MAPPRISMPSFTELLRLRAETSLSLREIGASLGLSYTAVRRALARARAAGLGWPLPEGLSEAALAERLYPRAAPPAGPPLSPTGKPLPDWAEVHRELERRRRRKTGVTLRLLWEDYRAGHPDGLHYAQFCKHYRRWAATRPVVMRHAHIPSEKVFVDYAGQTLPVFDPLTGTRREAQLFVAALGVSQYLYAEVTWTQDLADWCAAHARMLAYFGGAPTLLVPDNLKSGVTEADSYDPTINRTYRAIAPTASSPATTGAPCCPRAAPASAARPPSRWRCRSPSAGSSPRCATSSSSASTRRRPPWARGGSRSIADPRPSSATTATRASSTEA